MNTLKLFCFPYAGGSSNIFNSWGKYLDNYIELKSVELAGRGRRIKTPLYTEVEDAVDDIFNIVKNQIDDGPYALFGHSLGAMLVYELVQKMQEIRFPLPVHAFLSGRESPDTERANKKKYHLLSDDEFKKEIINLGGTPQEFFDYPELLEIFTPMLKNDFRLADKEYNLNIINRLNCDITVLAGNNDELSGNHCENWKNFASGTCQVNYFDGGHFFINDKTAQIVGLINKTLKGYLN